MSDSNETCISDYLPEVATFEEVTEALDRVRADVALAKAERQLVVEQKKLELIKRSRLVNSKYDSDNYPRMLIEHLREGRSMNTFGAVVGASGSVVGFWAKEYPAFAEARDIGMELQKYEWEDLMIKVAKGEKKGDFKAISFALKNYFPDEYADKMENVQVAAKIVIETGITKPSQINGVEAKVIEAEFKEVTKGKGANLSIGMLRALSNTTPSDGENLTDLL